MALKFLKPKGGDTPVKHLIHRLVAGVEEPRKHGTIHASELFKEKEFCPREWAFLDMGVVKKKGEFIGTAMKMTFDHGRDLEDRIRNEYIKRYIVGNWRCDVCGYIDLKFGKPPIVACPKCNHERWVYEEVRMEDPASGVSGGN